MTMLRFQEALAAERWEEALGFCSDRVKKAAAESPSPETFFEKTMPLDNAQLIVHFAKGFVDLYHAMISAESVNFELRYVISDSATCMVCGDQILGNPVSCMSCQTPHHEDCWQYLGRCSTYGCGQVSYHRATA